MFRQDRLIKQETDINKIISASLGNGDNTPKLHNKLKSWSEISIGKQNNQQIFIWQKCSLRMREKYKEKGSLCYCQSSLE